MLAIRTILHPTDFSKRSDFAFRLACSLARNYGARLIVAHVAEPPMVVGTEGMLIPPVELDLQSLEDNLQQLHPHPNVPVERRLLEGEAATVILQLAAETKCDVIVLGTHGRTGLGRLLLGSVAEQIVRKAPCPVLTVKTPDLETQSDEEPATTATGNEAAART